MKNIARIFTLLVTFSLFLGTGLSPVQAQPLGQIPLPGNPGVPGDPGGQDDTGASLNGQAPVGDGLPQDFQIEKHAGTGYVRLLTSRSGAALQQPNTLAAGASAESAALGFLEVYGPLFGLETPASQLRLMRQGDTEDGRAFVRFQQVHQGVPVLGGELIVQLDASRNVRSISGEALPQPSLQVQPHKSAEQAVQSALALVERLYGYPQAELQANQPELWIYNPILLGAPGPKMTNLVWRMEVSSIVAPDVRELVLVDAQLGSVVLNFNQIDSVKSRLIYNNLDNSTYGLPGNGPVRSEGGAATGINDVDRAYDYSGWTYDYYSTIHGRDSIDNKGMKLVSTVRYCEAGYTCPYANAFWNGMQMVYGSGYAGADDVVAHELTHGVTEHESNLFYYMQSGAINESLSDIWGELIDLTYDDGYTNDDPGVRWLMGENIPGGAIRSMSNPPAFGDPDKMTSPLYYCSTGDGGGVHTNSGVANKAAYLMVDGGSFNGYTVTGLGAAKTAHIWYEVQTKLLTSGSDYQDLNSALRLACNNLIGHNGITETDCNEVSKATAAVEMQRQPTSCPATDTLQCTNYNFANTFNAEAAGWTPQAGSWATDANTYYTTSITESTFASSAKTSSMYADFEYTVALRRLGALSGSTGVMVRGTPIPLGAGGRWHTGYGFYYTTDGYYSVWRYDKAAGTTLSGWQTHPAIITGDAWNVLKVIAQDNRFEFYINNVLVWSGYDDTYRTGYAGITAFRNPGSTGDVVYADYAVLNGGTSVSLLKDDFENPVRGLWSSSPISMGGVNVWHYPQTNNGYDYDATYTSSGNYNLWGYNYELTSDSYMQMNQGVSLPAAGNTYMTFKHAYSFEAPYYDGGVLEYSANGGAWTDVVSLPVNPFINNGYTGSISASFGNPLAGRGAFIGDSNGMITSRLALNSLAGNNVRFRFRIGTDSMLDALGWFIDDVDIYRCANPGGELFLPLVRTINAVPPVTAFHSGFNGFSSPWTPVTGNWSVSDIQYREQSANTNQYVSASYGSSSFSNFAYTARIKRSGCETCPSALLIRGTPNPLSTTKNWYRAYSFQVASVGQFTVRKIVNGVQSTIVPWTSHSAIYTGESWNLLKVVASNTNLQFYINDILVWSGSDTSLSSGLVGISAYKSYDSIPGTPEYWDALLVDWAHLTTLPSTNAPELSSEVVPGVPVAGGSAEMAPALP